MEFLLDTVALKRHFADEKKIGKSARAILDAPEEHTFYISAVSLMEILYLSEKNRIPISLDQTIKEIEKREGYHIINLSKEIIQIAQTISFYELHDRMILATAKFLDIPIISSDRQFPEIQEISTIWD